MTVDTIHQLMCVSRVKWIHNNLLCPFNFCPAERTPLAIRILHRNKQKLQGIVQSVYIFNTDIYKHAQMHT